MNGSVQSVKSDRRKAPSTNKKLSSQDMAPAILANGKTENRNSKLSSKQNMKKMDPGNSELEKKRPHINLAALKTQLTNEDLFISSLLTNIPTQGVSVVQNDDGTEEDKKSIPSADSENRACDPDELKERLAAKLSQFTGIKFFCLHQL